MLLVPALSMTGVSAGSCLLTGLAGLPEAGAGAGELIALFSLAMAAGMKAGELGSLVVPYPSFADIAVRLGAEFRRGEVQGPIVKYWAALTRLLG